MDISYQLRISYDISKEKKQLIDQCKIDAFEKLINKDYANIAGVVIRKDGEPVYSGFFQGCTAESRIHVYSVTKSVVSILIGIAVEEGAIKSVSQKVLEFFPDYIVKKREKTIQDITIEHLLTMTAPYKYRFAPYTKYFTSGDGVKFSLDLLGGERGDRAV